MRNHIRHNYPSLIHCVRAFHILFFAYLLFRCYCYKYYKNPKTFIFTVATITITIIPLLLLNTLLQILSYPGVVELTTQLLILKNILWPPLCRINKLGLNTLPSKAVVIPYTCGLSKIHLFSMACRSLGKSTKVHTLFSYMDPISDFMAFKPFRRIWAHHRFLIVRRFIMV